MAAIQKRTTKDGKISYRVTFRDPATAHTEPVSETHPAHPYGHQKSRSFAKYAAARDFAAENHTAIKSGDYIDPRAGRTPFAEVAARWLDAYGSGTRKPSTVATAGYLLRSSVLPAFGSRQIGKISRADVQAWANRLGQDRAASTVRQALLIVRAIFEEAIEEGLVKTSPVRKIERGGREAKESRPLNVEEVNRLADTIDPRYRALVLTAAFTGCRFGELAALRIGREGLDLLRSRLTVTATLSEAGAVERVAPKTKTSRRSVALSADLVAVLARHLADSPPNQDGDVFTAPEGGRLSRFNFRDRYWLPAVEAADLDGATFHSLRHAHASMLIDAGEHPKVIASRLGHSSISITMDIYGHLFDSADDAAAAKLDGLIGQAR